MFQVSDKVFYPRYGVGIIEDKTKVEDNISTYYSYKITLYLTKNSIFLPVEEAKNLGLRLLSSCKEVEEILLYLQVYEEEVLDIKDNWKERKKDLEEILYKGDIKSMAFLVKFLYFKSCSKPLGNCERKIYDLALAFLVDEIKFIRDINEITAEHIISIALLKNIDKLLQEEKTQKEPIPC